MRWYLIILAVAIASVFTVHMQYDRAFFAYVGIERPAHVKADGVGSEDDRRTANRHRRNEAQLYDALVAWMAVVDKVAAERGKTYIALRSGDRLPEGIVDEVVEIAFASDAAMDKATRLTRDGLGEPALNRQLAAFQETSRVFEESRKKSHAALRRIHKHRVPDSASVWFRDATGLIQASQNIALILQHRLASNRADLYAALEANRLAGVIGENLGQERALLGGAIAASAPLTQRELNQLTWNRSRLSQTWRRLDYSITGFLSDHAELAHSIRRIRRALSDFQSARNQVLRGHKLAARRESGRDGMSSDPYPMSASVWFDRATTVVDTVRNLGFQAIEFARAAAQTERRLGPKA